MHRGVVGSGTIGCVLLMAWAGTGAVTAAAQTPTNAAHTAASGACVALVVAHVEGVTGNATDVGVAVRDLFGSFLTGPTLHAVPLESRLVSQAIEEAQQKHCANLLLASVTMKRGGGGGFMKRLAGQAGSNVAWEVPYGRTATSAVARGTAIAAAQTMSTLASSTRAKDEVQLEYHVITDGGIRIPPTTKQAKARMDGEDLLTGLVQQASEAVAAAVAKAPAH